MGNLKVAQGLGSYAGILLGERQEQVLGANLLRLKPKRLLLRQRHDATGAIGESIKHTGTSYVLSQTYQFWSLPYKIQHHT